MVIVIRTEEQLEELLSRPSADDIAALARMDGDLVVLGAAGKMGPSLVRRAARARRESGRPGQVIAVARFSQASLATGLERDGARTVAADLLDARQVAALPDAPNVVFMVGRKFGSTGDAPLTWAVNTWAPGLVADRYADSRIVAFSTGNVYPFTAPDSGGPDERTPPEPVGEYAQSALARERIFEYFSAHRGTPVAILRLNYAIDLRYGVLLEIGRKVFARQPVDLTMGYVNVIWQGDANSACLRSFDLCSSPARILNLTGAGTLAVRALAVEFGRRFGIEPLFQGEPAPVALLSNAAEYRRLLGEPLMDPAAMIGLVADWIQAGGKTWDKPTHFEAADGKF
ncbi:MAG: NAD-dependent epimerase/dehydratase family protein [Bryobacteraceae bacterium]